MQLLAFCPSLSSRGLATLLIAATLLCSPAYQYAMQAGASPNQDPATAEITHGLQYLQRKDLADAKLRFSAAIKANPHSADALTWRGITENQLQQYEDAARDFKAALRIAPDELPAHYNLALSLIRLGEPDQAIEQLRYVVKVQPGVMEPEYNLAILLEQKHAPAEAVEHLKAANESRPNDLGVIQHLLVDLLASGGTDEASQLLEQVKAMDSVEAQQQVATALLEAGDYAQAADLLEGLHARPESSRESDLLLARAYIGAQEDFKAIDLLKPATAIDTTGEAAYLLGMAYSDAGATEEARTSFVQAIKQNPKNGRALYHLGLIESGAPGQLSSAQTHLREAMQQEPGNAAYGIALGRVMLQHDNAREALDLLQRVHAEGPIAGERDLLLGIAQIIVSGPVQAVKTLEKAVAENPSLALSQDILGFCYSVQGETAKAAEAYGGASDLDPKSRIFAHGAAVAFDRANDAAHTMTYATRAAALPGAVGQDYYFLGRAHAKANQNQDAIRELNQAIKMDPELEEAYYLLARTYTKTGETTQANEWVAKLKDLKQRHDQADATAKANKKQITSSTLLQGAPVESPDTVEH